MVEFDFEKFRLRRFVEKLIEMDEVEIHEEYVPLANLSAVIANTRKAVLFKNAGPEGFEIVSAVSASRRRLAAALGVEESASVAEYLRRMDNPQPTVEVPSGEAPVHEVVLQGEDIDLTKLPFHIQHQFDAGPYISSGIDYSVDLETGRPNVGIRRMMVRNRTEFGSNLTQPSDLRRNYIAAVAKGQRLPVSFAVGSHPLDLLAAGLRMPTDEFGLVATLRGEPLPMVRGLTNGILVPADAEMVVEGYFDEQGFREKEGPYGEFWGYYGPVHTNPVFHVTAITMRKDVLHQSILHGVKDLSRVELASLSGLHTEAAVTKTLKAVHVVPAAVHAVPSVAPRQHVRVALKRGVPRQARLVISTLFGMIGIKHVTVVDEDIDVASDAEVEWAMSTRFRADRDVVIESGFPGYYADPTADDADGVAKIGFDLVAPYGNEDDIETWRPNEAVVTPNSTVMAVREALAEGPKYFTELLAATGSDDGRELVLELDEIRQSGKLGRLDNGAWTLEE